MPTIMVNCGGNRVLAEKSYNVICILEYVMMQDCKEEDWLYAAFEYASIDQF
jgi:hypothetical protein